MDIFKKALREAGITGKDLSGLIGLSYSSYRSMLSRKVKGGRLPNWARAFMIGFELGKLSEGEK